MQNKQLNRVLALRSEAKEKWPRDRVYIWNLGKQDDSKKGHECDLGRVYDGENRDTNIIDGGK